MFSKNDLLFVRSEPQDVLIYEGQYAQKVVIVVPAEDYAVSKPFLEKMLSAAKLNLLQDTLVIQVKDQQPVNISAEIMKKQPDQVLVFGIVPEQLCLHLETKKYEPLFFLNTNLVFADRLPLLEPDKNLKTRLWTVMQVIFKL